MSPTSKQQVIALASASQFLRAAAWATLGVITALSGVDPTLDALRPASLPLGGTLALGAAALVLGAALAVSGYHLAIWRETRTWRSALAIAALDSALWALVGGWFEGRNLLGLGGAAFVLCGFAALACLGILAGKSAIEPRSPDEF